MAWTVAAVAGVVALGGCGSSGAVADRSSGGTGPVGGASSGGGGTTDRSGGTASVSGSASGPASSAGSPSGSEAGSPSDGASSAPSAAARSGDPCSLVGAADVARLAKLPPPESGGAPTTKPSQDGGGNKYCLVDDGESDSAQVGIGTITKEEFDLQKMSPSTQVVSGVGEEALYSPSSGILKVYKGGKQLSVWVIHGGFGGDDPQTLAQEKAIALVAVGRM
ncbi:hypothetical protein GCM10009838_39980 [Catenulispora subtropica]|uniref:Lipoprotein n=2 Tax=Catenulispora subtropica TaxID=450798 RepID=A0ABN2RVP5_9ACTN